MSAPSPPPPLCPCPDDGLPLWVNLLVAASMVCLSALFSGLSLGLLSMDKKGLQILAEAGTPVERLQASQIIPLRKDGNLLLCTLLLGNVVVNSCLSILLAGLTTGPIGLVTSATLIVICGEIIPQSICSRHGLLIGSATRRITWFFIYALYVVAKPISLCLDLVLGEEMGNLYSRDGLKRLLQMHAEEVDAEHGPTLTKEEQNLLAGAMEYSRKTVADVMTRLDRVFMLEANVKLTFDTMMQIYMSGYTRIPVFEGSPNNILGILYVKDLILVDPDDEIEVQTVVTFRGPSQVRFILDSTPLHEVFKIFKASYTHLMIAVTLRSALTGQLIASSQLATAPQFVLLQAEKEVTGVVTLEDILEEVIKAEIVDEHDVFLSNEQQERIKPGRDRPDVSTFLSLFEHKIRDSSKLTRHEVQAVCAFLVARVRQFAPFATHKSILRELIRRAALVGIDHNDVDEGPVATSLEQRLADAAPGDKIGRHLVLYKRGEASTRFSLILQGWVYVWAGAEEFESEFGPWSHLGSSALDSPDLALYKPDFKAATQGGPCRILQIERADFEEALSHCRAESRYGMEGVDTEDGATPVGSRGRRSSRTGGKARGSSNQQAAQSGSVSSSDTAPLALPAGGRPSQLASAGPLASAHQPPPFSRRIHTPNHTGVSPALVRPPQLSLPFRNLLDAEFAPDPPPAARAPESAADTGHAAANADAAPASGDKDATGSGYSSIEMVNVGHAGGARSPPPQRAAERSLLDSSPLVHNPFAPGNASFNLGPDGSEFSSQANARSLSVADLATLPPAAPSEGGSPRGGSGSSASAGLRALDGVIVMGVDGVPLCIEDGQARAMPLLDVPDLQSEANAATLKLRGLVAHNVRQQAGANAGGGAARSTGDMACVGEHTTLFMKAAQSSRQGSPLEGTPHGRRSAAGWFGSPRPQLDEQPLMGGGGGGHASGASGNGGA